MSAPEDKAAAAAFPARVSATAKAPGSIALRRYRGASRADVIVTAEALRERDDLRSILDLQVARGTAPNYYGRADGADCEYLLEAAVSPAADGLIALRETTYDAVTRKAVCVQFYDREQALGARAWVGRSGGTGSPESRASASAWLDAWGRIERMIADRLRGEPAKEGAPA